MSGEYLDIRIRIKDAKVIDKLEILRLERGISSNSFIIKAIAEKLRREGYLQGGIMEHQKVKGEKKQKELSDTEQLRRSLQKIAMRKP